MMAGKVDLPEDLLSPKPAWGAWATKEQSICDNIIPLSPQWLYAKAKESKDSRPSNSLPQRTSSNTFQKDVRKVDGSQEKKERRRNVLDAESTCHWREEERETGLLSRRERRKEVDRRSDSVSMRETTESRPLLSDPWHEVSGRNSGHESRRDNKWSSRWGTEDNEKDTRNEKKMDVDKEDAHSAKESLVGSNRWTSEFDSRDKWRPHHRLEVLSVGSSVYRAAPGFGLERGGGEGRSVGFAPGRGRPNFIGSLVGSRLSSAGPIGAPANKSESVHGQTAKIFCYPRGKLLDIYRKQIIFSPFDTAPEGFEEVLSITQPSAIQPLAFVRPDADEEDLLEDIWKGKIISSEVYSNASRDGTERVSNSTTDNDPRDGGCKVEVDTLIDGMVHGSVISTDSADVADCGNGLPGCNNTNSDQKLSEVWVVNGDELAGHRAFLENPSSEGIGFAASFDDYPKLPDDSDSLFDTSFIQDTSCEIGKYQDCNLEVKLSEQDISSEKLTFLYRDPQGEIQGPFLAVDIISWFDQGFFGMDLPVRLSDAPECTPFQKLGEVMPHLKLRSQPVLIIDPGDKSETSVAINGNRDADFNSAESDYQCGSSEFGGSIDHRLQPSISSYEDIVNPDNGKFPYSISETSADILSAEKNFHEFAAQDVEEVLHSGRPVSNIELPQSRAPGSTHFPVNDVEEASLTNHKASTTYNLNPLRLLSSELEETHKNWPLSSNMSYDQDHMPRLVLGGETSLFNQRQDAHSFIAESPHVHDLHSSGYRRSSSSNMPRDAMVARNLSLVEPASNILGLEEHLLSQKFQKQQDYQHHLLSYKQYTHTNGDFLEQTEGSVHHDQPINQSMPDQDHLLKLQFKQHFHQLQQQQQLRHQQKQLLRHQMQLLQQHQHQQQQQQLQQRLLLEQLLSQQVCDPGFGTSGVDPLEENNMFDHLLFRQRNLNESHQQSHQLRHHHDQSLEQLIHAKFGESIHHEHDNSMLDVLSHPKHRQIIPLEQQLLGLQQDSLQVPQFSMAPRHPPRKEEHRHFVGVRSVDESDHYIRAATNLQTNHQIQSARHGRLDFLHPSQRPSSIEQPGYLKHKLVHDQMLQGFYESHLQPFERSAPFSSGTPMSNVLERLQELHMQEQHGQMHSSGQMDQFLSGSRSHQNQINLFNASHVDGTNSHLPYSLVESQPHPLHLEVGQRKRDMEPNLSIEDKFIWTRARNGKNARSGLVDQLHQKQVVPPMQPLGMISCAPTSCYDINEPSWLFSGPATDNMDMDVSFTEDFGLPEAGQALMEQLVNAYKEKFTNIIENSGGLAFRSSSLPLDQESVTVNEEFLHSVAASPDLRKFSDMEGMKGNMGGSSSNVNPISPSVTDLNIFYSGIEQSGGAVINHGKQNMNSPVRHAAFGANGESMSFKFGSGVDKAYRKEMLTDRISGILSEEADDLLRYAYIPNEVSSWKAFSDLASVTSIRGRSPYDFPSSEGRNRQPRGNVRVQVPDTPVSSMKDARFHQWGCYGDADAHEASFVDMLKSSKKPPAASLDATGAADTRDACSAGRSSSKKKGKKGRQIDPSLLGFRVHGNRTLMGEIHCVDY